MCPDAGTHGWAIACFAVPANGACNGEGFLKYTTGGPGANRLCRGAASPRRLFRLLLPHLPSEARPVLLFLSSQRAPGCSCDFSRAPGPGKVGRDGGTSC